MLAITPFYFANYVDNLTGTPPAATLGANFTAGLGSADGAAIGVLGALAFDVHYLVIGIGGVSLSTANSQAMGDVLIDPAGGTSWSSLIDDLVCGFTPIPTAGTVAISLYYHFPVFIPAGASLGFRCKTLHTANITTGRVIMHAYGNPSRPDVWWCGTKVETLGAGASSSGVNVTPANTGAAGTWTNVGSVTSGRYGSIQFGLNGSDATAAAIGYYWNIGYGSTILPGSPTFYSNCTTAEVAAKSGFDRLIFCDIPQGTQMQVKGTASGTAEVHNVCLYGVY